jgi:NADH:ubiquinone oxidoreductase subunit H
MGDFLEALVVAFTILSLFTIIFGFALTMRYFKYKERKAIAEVNGRLTQKEPNDG